MRKHWMRRISNHFLVRADAADGTLSVSKASASA